MLKIFDLHNDYYLKLNHNKKKKYVSKHTNKNSIVSAIWTSELNCYQAMLEIENARNFVNLHKNLFLSVEDLHFLNNDNLEHFLKIKPIYAGLTWNTSNCLAGGAHEYGELTKFGKKVIQKLESHNIKVDSAHLNEESFMALSKITTKPLFCSHTAFFGVNEHSRNLKDYQLKMIVDSGGLVGLCMVSDFINGTKRCLVKDIVAQIDYFACKFGIENLAIGTDFYGTTHLPKSINNYDDLIFTLSNDLTKLGFTEKSLNKIFYENAQRFLIDVN